MDNIIPTGFQSIDRILSGGFHAKSLNIIAAIPGTGKTSFALQLADGIAKNNGKTVCFLSLECLSEMCKQKLKKQLGEEFRLSEIPIIIDDSSPITPNQAREKLSNIENLGAAFIDYMQLIEPNGGYSRETHKEDLCQIIYELRLLADDLRIPVIAISQLCKAVEYRPDHRPILHDFLYINDAVTKYADTVIYLHRDSYYDGLSDPSAAKVIVAKNRYGITDTLEFR